MCTLTKFLKKSIPHTNVLHINFQRLLNYKRTTLKSHLALRAFLTYLSCLVFQHISLFSYITIVSFSQVFLPACLPPTQSIRMCSNLGQCRRPFQIFSRLLIEVTSVFLVLIILNCHDTPPASYFLYQLLSCCLRIKSSFWLAVLER